MEELVAFLPEIALDAEAGRLVRNGIRIEPPAGAPEGDGPLRLTCEGRLVAIARVTDGLLRTDVVLQVIE